MQLQSCMHRPLLLHLIHLVVVVVEEEGVISILSSRRPLPPLPPLLPPSLLPLLLLLPQPLLLPSLCVRLRMCGQSGDGQRLLLHQRPQRRCTTPSPLTLIHSRPLPTLTQADQPTHSLTCSREK